MTNIEILVLSDTPQFFKLTYIRQNSAIGCLNLGKGPKIANFQLFSVM